MDKFQVGSSYRVLHLEDREEVVSIASRSEKSITLSDGRIANIVSGNSPSEGTEEVLRLDELGSVADGGVVRVCHLVIGCDDTKLLTC